MWIIQVLVGLIMGIICIFYVSQIFIPLFYCIPKSIYLVLRSELRPSAIFFWFWAPLIWLAIPFLIGFFFPSIIETSLFRFLDNPISSIVTNLMVAGLILSTIFTRKGRADAKEDFWNSMKKFRTARSNDKVEIENFGATLHSNDAFKMYEAKDYAGAIEKFNTVIAVFELNKTEQTKVPLNFNALLKEAYYNRGCAKDELKDYTGAIDDYTKAIELGPNNESEYLNRGLAKYELHFFQEAIKDYDKAIEIEPNKSTAYFGRANAEYQAGDKENACLDWSKASELGFALADDMINKYCK